MLPEWFFLLPPWLILGLVMGAIASVVVAGVFVVGGRLFPEPSRVGGPRVDGTNRRRTEIREYLRAIDEQFVEDHSVSGEEVAFFLPVRNVAITFDAQAFFRLERQGVFTVLCEYEMPGRHLGRRLPFEVPELEPELDDVDDPISEAFDRLGLDPTATPTAVRTAYRARVKTAHPDHGGDKEQFTRLREAYTVAREHAEASN
ncbi:J domain-containing protein [Haloferax namakaokahaiae]|uniref:J domain-containing protein n=1 Tax=Haloferax namakaokahaiae TaxID=1748331 RepID=A0ABD5ZGU8_9EURY